jgi:ketosteroid isomerase-like protein
MNTEENTIAAVLAKYEDALNHSNIEAVMKLYTPGDVVMPQNFPSCAGTDAVRKTCDCLFSAITLSVKFDIVEIHQLAPQMSLCANQFGRYG